MKATMTERANMMGMIPDGMMRSPMSMPATMAGNSMGMSGMNMMMVPRCTIKMEKCAGGMKITCSSDDAMTRSMMQNLCTMMANGMLSCCSMMNGMMVMTCNLTMGMCKCEMTKDGCMITCTSGDKMCCEMIQACCDAMCTMMDAGCVCCLMMNNMPVCCGMC